MKQLLLLGLLLAPIPAQAAVDPFYQGLLRDGQLAFDRKEYATAARALRLACFGMLDEPRPLADCLSRLALAQDGTGDAAGFRETFQRLLEVEDRFKGYSQGELPPELRAALEARLATRLPAATLAGAPAFRSTLAKKSPAPAASPALPRSGAPVASAPAATPPPAPVPSATTATPAGAKSRGPGAGESARSQAADRQRAQAARPGAAAPRRAPPLQGAAAGLRARPLGGRLASGLERGAAPGRRGGLPHLPLERRRPLLPPRRRSRRGGARAALLHGRLALRVGGPAAASAAFKRALPNLKRTPYVESYLRKILGIPQLTKSRFSGRMRYSSGDNRR